MYKHLYEIVHELVFLQIPTSAPYNNIVTVTCILEHLYCNFVTTNNALLALEAKFSVHFLHDNHVENNTPKIV